MFYYRNLKKHLCWFPKLLLLGYQISLFSNKIMSERVRLCYRHKRCSGWGNFGLSSMNQTQNFVIQPRSFIKEVVSCVYETTGN
jgi:hypothetical protein